MSALSFRTLTDSQVATALDDLARLRLEVFRDWPYLYDGNMNYEREYAQSYSAKPGAILVAAIDDNRIVGAATGTLMEAHADDFSDAIAGSGIDRSDIFYCAESVLLPPYRGQGAGHVFFDERERHARGIGRRYSAFAGLIRPDDHPMKPADYRPLDAFWRGRGYEKLSGAVATFRWKDVGQNEPTEKSLQFWIKAL